MDENNIKTTPTVSLTEHLSALLDDEAGSFEQRRVLDELKSNDELNQKLSSYALIGEVMRTGETNVVVGSSFLAGIHDKLESDSSYDEVFIKDSVQNTNSPAANDAKPSWLRPVGGFALAASVTAVAILGFQSYQPSGSDILGTGSVTTAKVEAPTTDQMALMIKPEPKVMIADATLDTSQYQQADVRTRQLLKRYVDSHMEYASNSAFMPSVRVIAYAE